jgi:hypothetical protein
MDKARHCVYEHRHMVNSAEDDSLELKPALKGTCVWLLQPAGLVWQISSMPHKSALF